MHTTHENAPLAEAEQRNQTNTTAPSGWFGTPMEMVADAFGMGRPWKHAADNRKAHRRNVAARRARRNKLAKASRKRNRR